MQLGNKDTMSAKNVKCFTLFAGSFSSQLNYVT